MFKNKEEAKVQQAVNDAKENIADLRESIGSLKTNAMNVAHGLADVGTDNANKATFYVQDRFGDLKATGIKTLERAEAQMKAKPGQAVTIAFFAGIVASYLLGRRGS